MKAIKNTIKAFACALLAFIMTSCIGEVVGEYSSHQCYYVMDFQCGHTTSYLFSALNSTNNFAIVRASSMNGTYTLTSEMYGATTRQETISEYELTRNTRCLGLNNNGVIVGRSSFQDGQLYVFDRQCPNCYNQYRYANYPLHFKDALNVECSTCHRAYSLLNGGVVTSGDGGEKLFRYHASYAGTLFSVQNPQ